MVKCVHQILAKRWFCGPVRLRICVYATHSHTQTQTHIHHVCHATCLRCANQFSRSFTHINILDESHLRKIAHRLLRIVVAFETGFIVRPFVFRTCPIDSAVVVILSRHLANPVNSANASEVPARAESICERISTINATSSSSFDR